MIKMFAEGLEPLIINQQPGLSPLFALCQWDWIKVGIRSNSIYQISQGGHMDQIIYKHCEWLSMQTVEFVEFTFQTDCIVNNSCLQSSNSSCRSRNNSDLRAAKDIVFNLLFQYWYNRFLLLLAISFIFIFTFKAG